MQFELNSLDNVFDSLKENSESKLFVLIIKSVIEQVIIVCSLEVELKVVPKCIHFSTQKKIIDHYSYTTLASWHSLKLHSYQSTIFVFCWH